MAKFENPTAFYGLGYGKFKEKRKSLYGSCGSLLNSRVSTVDSGASTKENFFACVIGNKQGVGMGKKNLSVQFSQRSPLDPLLVARNSVGKKELGTKCLAMKKKDSDLEFRNRNLREILRIRSNEILKKTLENKENVSKDIFETENEISYLAQKKISIEMRQFALKNEGISALISEKNLLQTEIRDLQAEILSFKTSHIDLKNSHILKTKLKNIRNNNKILADNSEILRKKLQSQILLNLQSENCKLLSFHQSGLSHINSEISKFSELLHSFFQQKPPNLIKLLSCEDSPSLITPQSLLLSIKKKLSNLRNLISDKYAEDFSESCTSQ